MAGAGTSKPREYPLGKNYLGLVFLVQGHLSLKILSPRCIAVGYVVTEHHKHEFLDNNHHNQPAIIVLKANVLHGAGRNKISLYLESLSKNQEEKVFLCKEGLL